jgi:diguanylate cyclase (GGDEF)-like protein/PAS domain S-box-containing protein
MQSLRSWRPSLRLLVAALAVAVVVSMAVAIAEIAASHLRQTAAEAAIHNVEAIVRGYVDPKLDEASLALGGEAQPEISAELERLTVSGDIRRISIWSRDGRIVYSTAPELRGERYSIGERLATAFLGTSISSYALPDADRLPPSPIAFAQPYLEIFVPIRGAVDGNPIGVYMADQDARPIEQRVEQTRRDVFLIALVAASLLAAGLALAFASASALLSRQNRLLRERAATERLLSADLRRSEERFRSLVRNAADIILIVAADGTVIYESPAVARILGYDPAARQGSSAFDVIHPGDVEWVRALFRDIIATAGAEVTADFRARHADGSWRWLEATAKNLLAEPSVGGIVVNYRDITERRSLEEQLRYQAFHDALTGLPNRALFMDRLGHALTRSRRDQSPLAVLFLDLDDFKAVNDRLGHMCGDELLVAVADRLRRSLREADTAARMGGDEFAMLLEDPTNGNAPTQIAERILEALRDPFQVQAQEVRTHGSIGIALHAGPGQTADELLRHADVAMYAAKSQGKNRLTVFQPGLHHATIDRHQLRADMHGAFEGGQFSIVYQPIVVLEGGAVTGAEALLRWRHPTRGQVGPVEFIPLAEQSGMIVQLGRWVLAEACQQARAWQDGAVQPPTVSVNLSARQLEEPSLVEDIAAALAQAGLDPSLLTLEITESVLLRDVEVVIRRLSALKELGVRLSIDDFGTGYSSLSYLRQLPVDELKIDRSFVAAVDGGKAGPALIKSIVSLAETMGLDTVAEGIEVVGQLNGLRSVGVRLGQGYLFARPMEAWAIPDVLAGRTAPWAALPRSRSRAGRPPARRRVSHPATTN